jgi:flagellar biosynthesis protein
MKKAVALSYDSAINNSPKVVGKGSGKLADRIIDIAKQNNLPIKEDPNLIELLSKVELDKEVPSNMYKAVAEVFKFLYEVSNKERKKYGK